MGLFNLFSKKDVVLNNSLLAWFDKKTQSNVHSNELLVMNVLKKHPNLSAREIAKRSGMKEISAVKRCCDLQKKGLIIKTSDVIEEGYKNSAFSINNHFDHIMPIKTKSEKIIDIAVHLLEVYGGETVVLTFQESVKKL